MSSKTLVLERSGDRVAGAVVESSIGSLAVPRVFETDAGASLPVAGPWDRVVALVAGEAAAFRVLELPFRDRRRAADAVGSLLEDRVPLSLDESTLGWDWTGPARQGRVVAALAPRARLEEDTTTARNLAGLAPQRLLWAPTAVVAAYRRALGETETFALVDVSAGGAVVASVAGGEVEALRIVAPSAPRTLLRNLAWNLTTVAAPGSRVVVGGGAAKAIASELERMAADFRFEPLPAACPVAGYRGGDWRSETALVGAILTVAGEASSPLIDFRADAASGLGGLDWRGMESELRPLARWAAAAAALGLLSIGLDYASLLSQRSALAAGAERIYASAMPSPSGGSGRRVKLEMRLSELSGRAAASASAGAAGSPLALLAAVSRAIPRSLDVVVDQIDQSPASAKIAGHAAGFETVTKMQQALAKSGEFARVEVKDAHAAVTGGGVDFVLELSGHAGAGS